MIFRGDVGLAIILNAGESIVLASKLMIFYRKPDGAIGQWPATLQGTNYASYTTASKNDLDQYGIWKVQLYAEIEGWRGVGEIADMKVYREIKGLDVDVEGFEGVSVLDNESVESLIDLPLAHEDVAVGENGILS